MVELLTSALLATVLLVVAWWLSRPPTHTRTGERLPPHVPHLLPFFGSMVAFGVNPNAFLRRYYDSMGEIFTFTMWGREMHYIIGPDGNNAVLNARHTEVNAEDAYKSLTVPVFGKGVVYDVPNEVLMEQKKMAKAGLTMEAFRLYVGRITEECVDYFARHWGESGERDLLDTMGEITILTASRCLLGKEIRAKFDTSFSRLYEDLDGGFQPINFLFPWLPLPSYRKRDEANRKMTELYLGIMRDRRANNDMQNKDMLQSYMDGAYQDGTKMTDEQIAHMMIALLMAGQHTSFTTSTWTGLYLLDNPEWKRRVLDEQRALNADALASPDGVVPPIDYEQLQRADVLHRVVKEALRLRPPIITIMRKVTVDQHYKGFTIPAGSYMCCAPGLTQRLETIYPQPERFDPDRYTPGREEDKVKLSHLPFGGGRHRCIGEHFAYLQIKTIWATLLRMYDIEAVGPLPNADTTKLIVAPQRPCTVRYKRRNEMPHGKVKF